MLWLGAPSAANAATTYRMAGFDGEGSERRWEENAFFTRMEARTGVQFTFDQAADADAWQKAKDTMFATGTLPDVLFKAQLSLREQLAYAQSGQLIDLKPLLKDNAPHLWALLEAHPDWLAAITLPSGQIVALPDIQEQPAENAMWINRTWLDTLGLAMPEDWASFEKVLQAFRTGDPNRNGSADEVPLSFLGPWDLKFLAHAFGLVANDYNIYADAQGAVRFMPAEEGYVTLLRALHGLYAQGLLDRNGFYTADTLRKQTDSKAVPVYGVFFGPNPLTLLPYETASQYELLQPLSYEGTQVYRELTGPVAGGAFAVTSACADPAALLQWGDVLYSEDGAAEAMAGTAGTDYTADASGAWRYTASAENATETLQNLSVYDTGLMPWRFPQTFYAQYDDARLMALQTQLAALHTRMVRPFPLCTLTAAQLDALAPLQAALSRYVDESLARFTLGEWNPDDPAAVQAYRDGLMANGQVEMVALWQEISDSLTK
jgi:putative aldouronate transport system substrate-binding protein